MLLQNTIAILAMSGLAQFIRKVTANSSQTEVGPLLGIWITIEILGFIKATSEDATKIPTTEVYTRLPSGQQKPSSSVETAVSRAPAKSTQLSKSVSSGGGISVEHVSTESQYLTMDDGDSAVRTIPTRSTNTGSRARVTNAETATLITDSSHRKWTLPSDLSLPSLSVFRIPHNSTPATGGVISNNSARPLGPTSYLSSPGTNNTSSNMSIFTGFGIPIYLNLPRYVMLLISALPVFILVMV